MATKVPFLDLRRPHREIETEIRAAVDRVWERGCFILGPEVERFESEWADYCGTRGAVTVGSGTDALALALLASGAVRAGRNDEVITTPLSAAYTALAIRNAGGVPVFADIDPHTLTLDPAAVEAAITPRTRAIVPVHIYGRMAEMPRIADLAARRGLPVIEDAAQSHGAALHGYRAGAWGVAAAFSFYPTKNLGAYGDGGAITSNDPALIEKAKALRQGGHRPALDGEIAGRNSRLDELQAAMLSVKLSYLDRWNARRRSWAEYYSSRLCGTRLSLPPAGEPGQCADHLFVVRHAARDRLRDHLAAHGIETLIHYPYLLHQQPLFRRDQQPSLPVAESVTGQILSLPLYPQLQPVEAEAVVAAICEFERTY
ncbi:MAG: DegT/DnrJ/EryC1/StrS family aminotransferase [Acidobacteria bacterium]|nr:DegT/DnrJ/EryC1/StrS family aminotransferase [Acidobacteriota bacterium]MCW5971560.1 DegT/DnrJ/EryC1/StrS family aminotransferase [Blastocatellales bacterium]